MSRLGAICLFCLCALPAYSAPIAFNTRQDLATGFQQLTGIVAADFNGDGKLDLAATDAYGKRVVVYLNNGAGGFGSPLSTSLSIPNTTGILVAGDVNEDGKQDLIVSTTAGSQTNLILLGNGDGTFVQSGSMPNSFGFVSGALVDINKDKHLDFIAGGNGSLYVYLGDGKGNFTQQPTPIGDSALFLSITTGDFNHDSNVDFVISTYGGSGINGQIRFYPGAGDGTFGPPKAIVPATNTGFAYLASADFNNDGKQDIAFSFPVIGALALGNGDGTFQAANQNQLIYPPQTVTFAPSSSNLAPPVVITDFDGNGTADFAIALSGENRLNIALNDGTGTFPQNALDFTADIQPNTTLLLTADLNGDGLPDVIAGSRSTNTIQVFLSQIVKTTPTVTLSSSAAQTIPGSAFTLSVKVMGIGTIPSGQVSISDGTTSLGQITLDATGQGSLSVSSLAAGQHSLTASYAGDTRFTSAASTALTQNVADFQLALTTTSQTITAGGTTSYAVTLTSAGNLTGQVTLTCTGLPNGYACSNSTATISGSTTIATVSVMPTARAMVQEMGSPVRVPLIFVSMFLPIGLLGFRRNSLGTASGAALLLIMLGCGTWVLTGCSSSSASTSSTYHGTTGFTITATATVGSQTLTHQTAATLTIQ